MPKRSHETLLIANYLERCFRENKLATYADMEKIVQGCSDHGHKRYCINSASKHLQIQYGYRYNCIQRLGYEPINLSTK